MDNLIHICTHGDGDRFDSPNGAHSACVTCNRVWHCEQGFDDVEWPDVAPLPTSDFTSYCYSCRGTRPFSGHTGWCIDCGKPHAWLNATLDSDSRGKGEG